MFCEIVLKFWFKVSCAKIKSGHFDSQDIWKFVKIKIWRVAKWGYILFEAF